MTNQDHNRMLSIFFLIFGGLQLFGAVLAGVIYVVMGVMFATSGDIPDAELFGGLFIGIGIFVALIIGLFGVFYLVTGWKMRNNAKIARVLGIIASCLSLPNLPLGTALGIYGLWFLFGDAGKEFYNGGAGSSAIPPPPPNSWQ